MKSPVGERAQDPLCDLIVSQLNFGFAYVREAKDAYTEQREEYGDLSRNIAKNSYAAASRFLARLPNNERWRFVDEVMSLRNAIEELAAEEIGSGEEMARSIA